MKVAYYSPLAPVRTGISEYSALLIPALARRVELEVVSPGSRRLPDADVSLYHVGNNPDAHGWIVEALRRRPGVVVLHDFVLHHLVAGLTLGRGDGAGYLGAMQREAGVAGRLLAHGVIDGVVAPLWEIRPDDFPLAGEVLEHAEKTGLVVHSHYVEQRAREAGYSGRLWRIPHPAWPAPDLAPEDLGEGPIVGSFGNLNASKRVSQLLEAFALVRRAHPAARLLLVGAPAPGFDVDGALGRAGLGTEAVIREDYVDEDRLWRLMRAADICVALRSPTMGETSGTVIRALALGRPLVVSDVGWFAELPGDVALRIAPDEDEVASLTAALTLLLDDDAVRARMSAAARAHVVREHDLERVADAYAGALAEAAGGEIVRDAVVGEIARAAAEVGIRPHDPQAAELARALRGSGIE